MKTTAPLFTDTVKIVYKKFLRFTRNGNGVYLYIVQRGENDIIEMNGDSYLANQGDVGTLQYTRKGKTWDFKPISFSIHSDNIIKGNIKCGKLVRCKNGFFKEVSVY